MSNSVNTDSSICRIKLRVGDLAYRRGDFHSALTNYERVRKHAEETGEQNFQSIALIKTAVCLSALDRLDDAERLIHQAESIETSRHVLEIDDAILLHHELSVLLFRLDRFSEGYMEERKALELLRKADHINNNLLVLVLKQLAVYASREEQFSLAFSFLDDAIAVALNSSDMGKHSLMYGQLLATYALAKIDMNKFEEAKELYERAITLVELNIGQSNLKVADLYTLFSQHLEKRGRLVEAEDFSRRAAEIERINKLENQPW